MCASKSVYSYPTSFGQVPVLVIHVYVLKYSLLKNFNLLLHLWKQCHGQPQDITRQQPSVM